MGKQGFGVKYVGTGGVRRILYNAVQACMQHTHTKHYENHE